ncbi:hypothetical protein D0Y65_000520 [Glycine soja]|uniref:Small ribosomal subunit protein mS23 n=1 Tax=Glycine soja TaxID=3848 RepID=A0A445LZ63_GLYSO|nr:hypothetical protein D0Y65_000520 [Glycine soja]
MSFMRGDFLSRTRKLVKGLAKAQPAWLKAMEHGPPATFPRSAGKIPTITLPEDVYVKKFYKKYPESKYHDAIKCCPFSLSLVFVPFAVFEHLVLVSALLYDVLSCYVSGLCCNMTWPREKIGGEVLSFDS